VRRRLSIRCRPFNVASSFEFVRAGKLRALGVTTHGRSEILPDVGGQLDSQGGQSRPIAQMREPIAGPPFHARGGHGAKGAPTALAQGGGDVGGEEGIMFFVVPALSRDP
jgi:hypothetical protein